MFARYPFNPPEVFLVKAVLEAQRSLARRETPAVKYTSEFEYLALHLANSQEIAEPLFTIS